MGIKIQNKLHDRLFSGLMKQLSKDDNSDARTHKKSYGSPDIPNTGVLSMLDQLMNKSLSPDRDPQ